MCTHETVLPRASVPLDDRLCTLPDGTFHSSPPIPNCRLSFPHRLQGALLLYKLLIPFVALAAVSSVINRRLHLPPLSLFLIGSFLSEILTITVRTCIPREWHTPRETVLTGPFLCRSSSSGLRTRAAGSRLGAASRIS